jgi:hypothetical protein
LSSGSQFLDAFRKPADAFRKPADAFRASDNEDNNNCPE